MSTQIKNKSDKPQNVGGIDIAPNGVLTLDNWDVLGALPINKDRVDAKVLEVVGQAKEARRAQARA